MAIEIKEDNPLDLNQCISDVYMTSFEDYLIEYIDRGWLVYDERSFKENGRYRFTEPFTLYYAPYLGVTSYPLNLATHGLSKHQFAKIELNLNRILKKDIVDAINSVVQLKVDNDRTFKESLLKEPTSELMWLAWDVKSRVKPLFIDALTDYFSEYMGMVNDNRSLPDEPEMVRHIINHSDQRSMDYPKADYLVRYMRGHLEEVAHYIGSDLDRLKTMLAAIDLVAYKNPERRTDDLNQLIQTLMDADYTNPIFEYIYDYYKGYSRKSEAYSDYLELGQLPKDYRQRLLVCAYQSHPRGKYIKYAWYTGFLEILNQEDLPTIYIKKNLKGFENLDHVIRIGTIHFPQNLTMYVIDLTEGDVFSFLAFFESMLGQRRNYNKIKEAVYLTQKTLDFIFDVYEYIKPLAKNYDVDLKDLEYIELQLEHLQQRVFDYPTGDYIVVNQERLS